MVSVVVTSAIIILLFLAAVEAVHIFLAAEAEPEDELRAFTVLVYRKDDLFFEKELRNVLAQLRWTEPCFCSEIYIVHMNVPEAQSANVRELCDGSRNLVYVSMNDFIKMMNDGKNSAERDCNLSKKGV